MIGFEQLAVWVRRRQAVRRRFNPYLAGAPVLEASLLFGREASTRRTLDLLELGHVSVVGERRIGKTSFLHHLRTTLVAADDGERNVPVFVDLESVSGEDLHETLLEETALALAAGRPGGAGLPPDAGSDHGVEGCLRECERLISDGCSSRRRPVRLVYLIDEVDVLEAAAQVGESLAGLTSAGRAEVRFVTAGVRSGASPAVRLDPNRPFSEVELAPLSPGAAEALVRRPVAGAYDYEDAAVSAILERSGLRPFQIQTLCLRAVERMLGEDRGVIRQADVEMPMGWEPADGLNVQSP